MGTFRWQNVLFALLPALEWVAAAVPLLRARAMSPCASSYSAGSRSLPRLSWASCRRCWSGRPFTASTSLYRLWVRNPLVGAADQRHPVVVAQRLVRNIADSARGAIGLV